jgi:RNA polymerase sigma-54 factor
LIQRLEHLNQRKSTLFRVLEGILDSQRAYFEAEGKNALRPQRQKDLAATLGIHASLVSRALAGRSLRAPWGEEIPLKDFFPVERRHSSLQNRLRRILLEKGKPLGDRQIALRLTREYGETVAPRTVARYRNALGFPNVYGRLQAT